MANGMAAALLQGQHPIVSPYEARYPAPRSGAEVGLNLLAQGLRQRSQRKSAEARSAELARILQAGGREEILSAAAGSNIPELQNLALAEALKAPKREPLFGASGLQSNLLEIALTGDTSDPRTLTAYQQLKTPKTVVDQTTGNITTITPQVPEQIEARFRGITFPQADPETGLVDAAAPVEGFEEVAPGVQVKKGAGKPAPLAMVKAIQSNAKQLRQVDEALQLLQDPAQAETVGLQNRLPGADIYYQFAAPEATRLRSLIAGIQNLTIKDLSGATVTVGEEKRLAPYVPSINDRGPVLEEKLKRFYEEYRTLLQEQGETVKGQGFREVDVSLPDRVADGQPEAPGPGYLRVRNPSTGEFGWFNEETGDFQLDQ